MEEKEIIDLYWARSEMPSGKRIRNTVSSAIASLTIFCPTTGTAKNASTIHICTPGMLFRPGGPTSCLPFWEESPGIWR